MGASRNGGYQKLPALDKGQNTLLQQLLNQSGQNLSGKGGLATNPAYQQALSATQQFLPGGQGFQPIQQEAQRNFQQQTVPNILNAFGQNTKGSSALNQALASAGGDLNTSLASQLAQMQLGAAGQTAQLAQAPYQLGSSQAQLGLGTPSFAYAPKQLPFWQQALLGNLSSMGSGLGSLGQQSKSPVNNIPGTTLIPNDQSAWQRLLSGAGSGAGAGSFLGPIGAIGGGLVGGLGSLFGGK